MSVYPDSCLKMQIDTYNTVRCECKKYYKDALKLKKKYDIYADDIVIVETYKRRFQSIEENSSLESISITPELEQKQFSNKVSHAFSEENLRLVLQVMLYSGDVAKALEIVRYGVKKFPKSVWWNEKAAEIALWNNQSSEALDYYLQSYQLQPSKQSRLRIEKLATQLQNEAVLLKILKDSVWNNEEHNRSKLYEVYLNSGELSEGIDFFDALYRRDHDKESLKSQISLLIHNGEVEKAQIHYTTFIERFSEDVALSVLLAKAVFSRKQIEQSYKYLYPIHRSVAHNNHDFWHFYIDILWLRRSYDELYSILLQRRQMNLLRPYDYERLAILAASKDKAFASELALERFNNEGSIDSLLTYVYLSIELKAYEHIDNIFLSLSAKQRQSLEKMEEYWVLKAQINTRKGLLEEALSCYKNALAIKPNNVSINTVYVWFLLEYNRIEELYREKNLRRGWTMVRRALKENPDLEKDGDFLTTYLRLANHFEPQKKTKWSKLAKKHLSVKNYDLFLFGLAVTQSNDEAIRHLKQKLRLNEPWIEFYLSVLENDTTKISEEIETHSDILPTLDVVNALSRSGHIEHAKQLVYDGLEKNPNNDEYYKTMHDLYTDDKSIGSSFSYNDRSVLTYQEFDLKTDIPFSKKYVSTSNVRYRQYHSDDPISLPEIPTKDQSASVEVKNRDKYFTWDISLGYRDYLDSIWTGSIDLQYRYGSSSLSIDTDYHTDADESVYMSLGGYKDSISVGLNHQLMGSLELNGVLKLSRFYVAGGDKAGEADEVLLSVTKHLREGYPDVGFRSSVGYYGYSERFADGKINTILPSYPVQLLPESFFQWSIGSYYGIKTQEIFQRKWRPYGNIDVAYNSQNGTGFSVIGGIGGMLLGEDRLSLEANYASSFGNIGDDYYRLSLMYYLYGW
ncbi:MAG: tetratricopeptide repeat protein [Sulfuricurvum sp.]|nr:tetratricopeptide repeat protein [Sulfuricurvum sp.]